MKQIDFSKFNERVLFQKAQNHSDDLGGYIAHWQDYCWLWANLKPMKCIEKMQNSHVVKRTLYQITIRLDTKINSKMRILHNKNIFEIRNILNTENKRFSIIYALKEG